MVLSPKELGPEKDCAGKGQQHIKKTDPSSRQRGRPSNIDECTTLYKMPENRILITASKDSITAVHI
jgi:hypothetical protein